jgi:Ser/Thr protein kinase RdoA (MazF antagonist)
MNEDIIDIANEKEYLDLAQRAIARWGGDYDSLSFISISANIVYRFECGGQGRYLRLRTDDCRTIVESGMDYMQHMVREGVSVCRLLPSEEKNHIEDFDWEGKTYLACVLSEAPGKVITNRCRDSEIYTAWGKAMAQFHLAAQSYRPQPAHSFFSWEAEWENVRDRLSPEDTEAWKEFELVNSWVKEHFPLLGDFGLAHGDFNAGNVLWDGAQIWIIDFDEPLYHSLYSDVARPFRELAHLPQAERRHLLDCFLEGYEAVRTLTDLSVGDIAWLIRMKNMDGYTWNKAHRAANGEDEDMIYISRQFTKPVRW